MFAAMVYRVSFSSRRRSYGCTRCGCMGSRQASVDRDGTACRPEGGRSAGRDQGDRHLPHRRIHALGRGSRRVVPRDPRSRGRGHRGRCRPGVSTLKKGDHVIPLYVPECRQCKSCLSRKTNLCTAIRVTQGKGQMPDGTSRFSINGKPLHHYMGCSTFANFTVLPEIAVAKIREDAPFDKVCYIGCGVTTGIGAVINTAKVEAGANVVVFG